MPKTALQTQHIYFLLLFVAEAQVLPLHASLVSFQVSSTETPLVFYPKLFDRAYVLAHQSSEEDGECHADQTARQP
jgi:hypothetical protein